MATRHRSKYDSTVNTAPVKRFFVDMLTRDIALEDALLDLLDNCIDGVQRSVGSEVLASSKPYKGYWAKITLSRAHFQIEDNCGGIPWTEKDRAFRMGAPNGSHAPDPSRLLVGTYGIGMKRAIFKLGKVASVLTKTEEDEYEVSIPPGWMDNPDLWVLQTGAPSESLPHLGTRINVSSLRHEVAETFTSEIFQNGLIEKISTHFSIIIGKGLKITVKTDEASTVVPPKLIGLRFQEGKSDAPAVIRPYFFHSTPSNDVEVTVVVGLREPIPGVEKVLDELEGPRFSTDYAGWTVICNDRVVLYCNRDELTGWGTDNIPRYHTQFIAISGYVEFRGDPAKLPTTTTKRGLEFSSRLYQQVLNRMREGMRLFTTYTNWWKTNENEAKRQVNPAPALQLAELKKRMGSASVPMTPVHTGLPGQQYRPKLPRPVEETAEIRIAFTRPRRTVLKLAEACLDDIEDIRPADVPRALGEHLFDSALKSHRIR